jgi:membrane-associated HD superfamily phosphohydrolase
LWAVWVAIATAVLVPATPLLTLVATAVGSLAAVAGARRANNRAGVLLAGVLGGLASGSALVAMVLLGGGLSPIAAATAFGIFVAAGALGGVLALALLPLAESAASAS